MRFLGQTFGAAIIERIRAALSSGLEMTGSGLSRRLCERLGWYAVRWRIEVFHRTLKSGCRIEDRRLAEAGNLQACLALDRVVAWRVLYLTHLGRQTPQVRCRLFFEEARVEGAVQLSSPATHAARRDTDLRGS
jgi:hypothetical protein